MLTDTIEQIANTIRGVPNETPNQEMIADLLMQIADNLLATSAHPGMIQLATNAEATAGTATDRALTPANLGSFQVNSAFASDAEAQAKTSTTKALNPKNLAALASSATFAGLVELATTVEAAAMSDTDRAVTAAGIAAILAACINDMVFAASKGPVIKSPDGSNYRIKVADDGTLSAEEVV